MAQSVTIAGVTFPDVPSVNIAKAGGGQALFVDPSPTTATAADVGSGKIFFAADGSQQTGTANIGGVTVTETPDAGGGTIIEITGTTVAAPVPIILRPDAELVKTYTYDKYINADEGITIPAYTTTATVLKASVSLSPTYTVSLGSYNYYVVERMLTIPEYSITTLAKGRAEYSFAATGYEIGEIPANIMHALIEPSRKITSRTTGIYNTGNFAKILYYQSATSITTYSSAGYAVYQTVTAPALSGSTLTLKSPAFGIRGHTTYFTSTFFNALTDIRYQYRIEVWRAPKDSLSFDGWTLSTNADKLLTFLDSPTHTLT